jgi:hypothetical protein
LRPLTSRPGVDSSGPFLGISLPAGPIPIEQTGFPFRSTLFSRGRAPDFGHIVGAFAPRSGQSGGDLFQGCRQHVDVEAIPENGQKRTGIGPHYQAYNNNKFNNLYLFVKRSDFKKSIVSPIAD